jgi:hypothetical protein
VPLPFKFLNLTVLLYFAPKGFRLDLKEAVFDLKFF